jgi:hypothetical protein
MRLVLSFLQAAPIAASLIGITAFSGCAAEIPSLIKSRQSTTDPEPSLTESISAEPIAAEPIAAEPVATGLSSLPNFQDNPLRTVAFETADNAIAAEPTLQFSSMDSSIEDNIIEDKPNTPVVFNVVSNTVLSSLKLAPGFEQSPSMLAETLSAENLGVETLSQPTQADALAPTQAPSLTGVSSKPQVLFRPIALSDLSQIMPEPGSERWRIAQSEPALEPEAPQPTPKASDSPASPRWRFSVTPYAFAPFSVNGDVTVRNFSSDFNVGLSDILDRLNFALAGRVEAWRGNLGLIFDGSYFNLGQDGSVRLSTPNCLCNVLPSRINTEINVQYGQFDLGFGYRYGTNVSNAATEFEMGPLVFDAIVGMRIYTFDQEINISTNLGGERNLQGSTTLITPLASGRIRWNISPTLAGWVRGDLAGFGIGGTLFATSFTAGIDWRFAGNTSLLLAYRLSTLQYNTDVRGEELGVNLLLHGPYIGMVFRF